MKIRYTPEAINDLARLREFIEIKTLLQRTGLQMNY